MLWLITKYQSPPWFGETFQYIQCCGWSELSLVRCHTLLYFNTSNVVGDQQYYASLPALQADFNTSNVVGDLVLQGKMCFGFQDFNTSNVVGDLINPNSVILLIKNFNTSNVVGDPEITSEVSVSDAFQYIQCCGWSKKKGDYNADNIVFQYIQCCGWSEFIAGLPTNILEFQYIQCCGWSLFIHPQICHKAISIHPMLWVIGLES